jgi:hypothetical protein
LLPLAKKLFGVLSVCSPKCCFVCDRYVDKIGETRQQLYDLILAANYMDIKSLLHLGCAKVASLIKGQPLEKIKEILDPNQGAKKDKDSKESTATATGTGTGSAAAASEKTNEKSSDEKSQSKKK